MIRRIFAFLPVMFAALLLAAWAVSPAAHASDSVSAGMCYSFSDNIRLGQQDTDASHDVDTLQHFLADSGYFAASNIGTGHFGPLTKNAVIKFQAVEGVPATGFVGPLTRAAIAKTQENCADHQAAAPKLYSLSPEKGAIGDTISIRGFGFATSSNIVLIDGMVAARNVPISSSVAIACTTDPSCHGGINQTLTFTIPSAITPYCAPGYACMMLARLITPGTTTISVRTDAGISNSLDFTVTK